MALRGAAAAAAIIMLLTVATAVTQAAHLQFSMKAGWSATPIGIEAR